MKWFLFFPSLFICFGIQAQDEVVFLEFTVSFSGEKLVLDQPVYLPLAKDSVHIEVLRFYLSDFHFFKNKKEVGSLKKKQHLLDYELAESMFIQLDEQLDFDSLSFCVGIDSLTNISGAFDGDLDPMHGMYWTWQSGYINFKLEGVSPSCPAHKNRFLYHLGGYEKLHNAFVKIGLPMDSGSLKIALNLDGFFEENDLTDLYKIMSPSQNSMTKSQRLSLLFSAVK